MIERELACRTPAGRGTVRVRYSERPPFVLELVRDGETAARYEDEDMFSCLLALRRDLERDGVVLCCAGALRNAYPSAMSRSAGGYVVYLLEPGQPASETADIFDPVPCEDTGTVDEQLAFYRSWLASLDAVPEPPVSPRLLEEAASNPGGWVYAVDEAYEGRGEVPPSAIRGAWRVDEDGNVSGEFVPNPNYGGRAV